MIIGTRGYSSQLDRIDAPLNVMAEMAHVGLLQIPLSLGAMVSFFALCLSCVNAGSRVVYAMGRHGIFHEAMGESHKKNETPHIAVTIMAASPWRSDRAGDPAAGNARYLRLGRHAGSLRLPRSRRRRSATSHTYIWHI